MHAAERTCHPGKLFPQGDPVTSHRFSLRLLVHLFGTVMVVPATFRMSKPSSCQRGTEQKLASHWPKPSYQRLLLTTKVLIPMRCCLRCTFRTRRRQRNMYIEASFPQILAVTVPFMSRSYPSTTHEKYGYSICKYHRFRMREREPFEVNRWTSSKSVPVYMYLVCTTSGVQVLSMFPLIGRCSFFHSPS